MNFKHILIAFFLPMAMATHATPISAPQSLTPHLALLYSKHGALIATLESYADTQGFRGPIERVATVLHELVHIESAARGGYVIQGASFAPYNQPTAWPGYKFAQFRDSINVSANATTLEIINTPVFQQYVINTPNNTLASLADELNAYGETTDWLCRSLPRYQSNLFDERTKSVQSMRDMLRVTNLFLQTLRITNNSQYVALLTRQKEARNLLALTILNAKKSLAVCGSTLKPIDSTELDYLVLLTTAEASKKH